MIKIILQSELSINEELALWRELQSRTNKRTFAIVTFPIVSDLRLFITELLEQKGYFEVDTVVVLTPSESLNLLNAGNRN